jgi:DNA-binding XRE family transcriptional regulator
MVTNVTDRERSIARLQQNLSAIRKVAGWTTEQLGDKIGVSKQTISNLENGKSPMNFTQYIAIRSVLDCEMNANPDNDVLPKVITVLLDSDDDEYDRYREPVNVVAATAAGGVSAGALAGVFTALVPTLKFTVPAGIACAPWLRGILKNK